MQRREGPREPEREEVVLRVAQPVERRAELIEAGARRQRGDAIRDEARDHRVRAQHVVVDGVERAVAADPEEVAVERDHLAVETFEGPQPEVAMLAEGADADSTLVHPFDQRPHGRDLEDRLMVDVEQLRERRGNEMAHRLARLGTALFECPPQPVGDAAPELVAGHVSSRDRGSGPPR